MYTKMVPFKDFRGTPRNLEVNFNLTEPETFKLIREFQLVFEWRESMDGPERELESAEVIEFYTAFEEILLAAWGVPSDDGLYFRKSGRYDFQESALFAACMVEFVTNPEETMKLVDGIMPKGLEDIVKKADANLAAMAKKEGTTEEMQAEIERLRKQLGAAESEPSALA